MDSSTMPLRTRFTAANVGVALVMLMLTLAACRGASNDPVAEIAKLVPLEPGRGLLVFVYTDG
ncbi:MAG: hypothetical protein AB7T37_10710 [Dehalococcoidia bacterium]